MPKDFVLTSVQTSWFSLNTLYPGLKQIKSKTFNEFWFHFLSAFVFNSWSVWIIWIERTRFDMPCSLALGNSNVTLSILNTNIFKTSWWPWCEKINYSLIKHRWIFESVLQSKNIVLYSLLCSMSGSLLKKSNHFARWGPWKGLYSVLFLLFILWSTHRL